MGLVPGSWRRSGGARAARLRWLAYVALGAASAALIGPYLVVVIALCGALEIVARRPGPAERTRGTPAVMAAKASLVGIGGLGALVWVAFKVGALSYGGGFVIVPLMQHSAVVTYHWMTGAQFLDAVALGQVTPGPVVRPLPSSATPREASEAHCWRLSWRSLRRSCSCSLWVRTSTDCARINAPSLPHGRRRVRNRSHRRGCDSLGLALSSWWQVAVLGTAGVWLLALRRGTLGCLLEWVRSAPSPSRWALRSLDDVRSCPAGGRPGS